LGWLAPLDHAISPEGEYVITGMQENALHGLALAREKLISAWMVYPTENAGQLLMGQARPLACHLRRQRSHRLARSLANSARKANHHYNRVSAAKRSSPPSRSIPSEEVLAIGYSQRRRVGRSLCGLNGYGIGRSQAKAQ
jgi:hypothetical protein